MPKTPDLTPIRMVVAWHSTETQLCSRVQVLDEELYVQQPPDAASDGHGLSLDESSLAVAALAVSSLEPALDVLSGTK